MYVTICLVSKHFRAELLYETRRPIDRHTLETKPYQGCYYIYIILPKQVKVVFFLLHFVNITLLDF